MTTRSGIFLAPEANLIFSIAPDKLRNVIFNRIWIYPASGVTGGKLVANAGTVFVGERTDSGDVTPDPLDAGDGTAESIVPFRIELPEGQGKALKDVLMQAVNDSDGVWFKFWPAQ